MKVVIHKDQYGKIDPFVAKYKEILDINGIANSYTCVDDIDFWEQLQSASLFIFRYSHYDWHKQIADSVLPLAESRVGVKVFPDQASCWHFDDKIRQFWLMKLHEFPFIESWVFYDKHKAESWIKEASYPLVFKLNEGAGSSNVMLIYSPAQARKLVRRMFGRGINPNTHFMPGSTKLRDFNILTYLIHILSKIKKREDVWHHWKKHKNYIYFQKFLPHNDFDTRITIIGDRAFAFRRFNRKNDFRSSGSGFIDYEMDKIDPRCIEMAFKVSAEMKFQSMAYDFLFDEQGNPHFCEISYTFMDTAVQKCPGYWDSQMHWHTGNYWPQYCQLSDLLGLDNLIQPNF